MAKYNTYLMLNGVSTYEKLVDIKNHGDIHGEAESIERTTKSDTQRTFTEGLLSNDAKKFLCNYVKTDYATLKALEGAEKEFAIYFGDIAGVDGKFGFKGYLRVKVLSSDVGTIPDMEINIIPSTAVTDLE